jgi:hypothetical protein
MEIPVTHADLAPQAAATASADAEAERLHRARRRVAALKGFYVHLAVYLAVNAGLFVIDLMAGRDWWVQWVIFGWGIGIAAHALAVFGGTPRAIADWEERKVQQYMSERR